MKSFLLNALYWFLDRLLVLKSYLYSKKFSECGKNLLVYGTPQITYPWSIKLGNEVCLNDGCILNATESSIEIGDNVTISQGAKVLAASYNAEAFLAKGLRNHVRGGGKNR